MHEQDGSYLPASNELLSKLDQSVLRKSCLRQAEDRVRAFTNINKFIMAFVTANIAENGRPLKRVFVEHTGPFGIGSLGWALTDSNGSFTFDAGPLADHVDIKIHCQNSVIRVLDGSTILSPIEIKKYVGNGDSVNLNTASEKKNHFRILNAVLDVYDSVWRQFRPYNGSSKGDFPLGRKSSLRATFSDNKRIELSFPDNFPSTLAFVEPSGLSNAGFPLVHVKSQASDNRLFGSSDSDPSLLPHEIGHAMHFSALSGSTRTSIEAQYIQFILSNLHDPTHNVTKATTPFVAFIEAVGIFSERFFFFRKRVRPDLTGVQLRQAFIRDELEDQTLASVLVDTYDVIGTRASGRITPNLTGDNIEGAVYGAIYLDFANRVGLREAVGLVLESNATSFDEFRNFVRGKGNSGFTSAINAVRNTWGM